MDKVAAAAGLTPEEFRRRNFIGEGQTSAIGQVMREPVEMDRAARSRARALGLSRQARALRAANPPQRV